jgi:RsiW-degrading membrane proteinase PrsW (M82 family)
MFTELFRPDTWHWQTMQSSWGHNIRESDDFGFSLLGRCVLPISTIATGDATHRRSHTGRFLLLFIFRIVLAVVLYFYSLLRQKPISALKDRDSSHLVQ